MEFLNAEQYDTVEDGLAIFGEDTLLFEPETRYSYSSYGWNLLSAVIEGASGKDFLDYMKTRVIEPIGLNSIVPDIPARLVRNRTRFYIWNPLQSNWMNAPYVDNSYKWAGGGYLGTASDLCRFGYAMTGGRFLRPETEQILFTPQRTRNGESTDYGIGWRSTEIDGKRVVWHSGGSIGGVTVLLVLPNHGIAVAAISNSSGVNNLGGQMYRIMGRLAGQLAEARADE